MTSQMHPKFKVEWTTFEVANNSPSKMTFSFPRNDRFKGVKPKIHDLVGYDLGSTRANKSPTFGIGSRFTNRNSKTFKQSNSL
jgi:hypothetical protein